MSAVARTGTATVMAFRDQRRRPLVLILLVVVPAYVITKSIAQTQSTPRQIGLPGGGTVTTTMKDLHGAVMAGFAIAFVASLIGVFVMQSALAGDRRLVLAGFRPGETVIARLIVLITATMLVVAVSLGTTAVFFTPASWVPLTAALVLTGLIYAALGALAGAVLDKLAATYLMLFLVMTDIGIVQNPMFGNAVPGRWAPLLPWLRASSNDDRRRLLTTLSRRRGPAARHRLAGRPGARCLPGPTTSGRHAHMNERTPVIIDSYGPASRSCCSDAECVLGSRVLATSGPVHLQRRLGGRNET